MGSTQSFPWHAFARVLSVRASLDLTLTHPFCYASTIVRMSSQASSSSLALAAASFPNDHQHVEPAQQQQQQQAAASSSSRAPLSPPLNPLVRVKIGTLDSYLIREYLSSSQADDVLRDVDGYVTYLARTDPRMLFKIYGKSLKFPRDKAFYGNVTVENGERVEPFYKYAKDTPPVESWAGSVLEEVKARLQRSCGQPCNMS